MDAEQRQNDCVECAQLRQELQALREQVTKLTAALEEERRRGKRQAAPFSKGPPVTEPKPPGRKSGKRHGPHAHRSVPPRIDETYDAPRPPTCPHCASRQVHETHVAAQYQTEIPRTVIYRRFDVQVGTCDDCGRRVAGRHALQTSSARGAAASQLGPQVHALLTILNKELGLSHGKSVRLLGTLFPELQIALLTAFQSSGAGGVSRRSNLAAHKRASLEVEKMEALASIFSSFTGRPRSAIRHGVLERGSSAGADERVEQAWRL